MRFTTLLPILLGASFAAADPIVIPGFEGVSLKDVWNQFTGGGQSGGGRGGGGGGGQAQGQPGYCNHGWGDDGTCKAAGLNAYCCAQKSGGDFKIGRSLMLASQNSAGTGCGKGGIIACAA